MSEFMLQQTPVSRVLPQYRAWIQRWPSIHDLAQANTADVLRQWGKLGYPRRALRLHACAQKIVSEHHGVIPSTIPELEALPGIGTYTARAICSFAHQSTDPVIDVNVRRVLVRSQEGVEDRPEKKSDLATLDALIAGAPERPAELSGALMELGALVCTKRSPRCAVCPLVEACAWEQAGKPALGTPLKKQAAYAGSDRQVRGILLGEAQAGRRLDTPGLSALWDDKEQLQRALASLVSDGLLAQRGEVWELP